MHMLLHITSCRPAMLLQEHTPVKNTQKQNPSVEVDVCAFAVADDLLLINDISVDESEDLPKILRPLVEEGPLAALGRAHQQPSAAFSPATNKRQLLQTMKLAAPAIVKLQVPPCTCAAALTVLCQAIRCYTGRVSCMSTCSWSHFQSCAHTCTICTFS